MMGIGYGTIDPVNQTSTTHSAITDQAGLSHINTESFKQEEVQHELNQIIANDFDKEQAVKELNAQVTITQAFDAERRAIRSEYAKKAEGYRKQAEELPQGSQERTRLEAEAKQIDDNLRLFDGITSALYAPNPNGIIGDVARAASPELAYQIGQYFKNNKTLNQLDNGNRPEEQSVNHLLAHAILGAAVSYATGNNPTTGALSGASSEVAAPALADYLYGTKDPELLTQDQKDAITSILNLATVATAYTTTGGNVTDTVNAVEVGKVGVENNWGGEAWAYAVGGGKEYAQSQASLGAYCAQQGGDYATCMGWTKQDLLSSVIELHQKYNHMTIMSVSRGGVEQIFIINNKNGNVYASVLGFNASYDDLKKGKTKLPIQGARTPGMSVSWGNIEGRGDLKDEAIDAAIEGLSFSAQVCHGVCLGTGRTLSGTPIHTYGMGSPGAGVSINHMVKLPFRFTEQELQKLIRK
ncbi:VENN motif pre-toxin domain-containing protein [Moraxella caviae]|nr:VENN motif pre-toxin domain-containing protein [Moraxella caviae]